MPKIPSPKSPTNDKRLVSSTSKRSPRKKKTTQDQDRSQWRSSWISEDTTISKKHAVARYHISAKKLQGLRCTLSEASVKIKDVDEIRPMHLYKERDVEMQAWEKYGGPEGFQKMLDDKSEKFYAKYGMQPRKTFPKPNMYTLAKDPKLAPHISIFERPKHQPSIETSTPNLIRIKEKMGTRGQKWLWDALNKMLSETSDSRLKKSDRESLILCAFRTLGDYPKRPSSPFSLNSSSFCALNNLLTEAPSVRDAPGIEEDVDGCTGETLSVDWIKPYKDKVYNCLNEVLTEHGTDGLKSARWLVYDKYVECRVGGLEYYKSDNSQGSVGGNEWQWSDGAKFWLHEPKD